MGSTRRDLTRHRTRSYYTKEIKQTKWQTKQQPVVNGSMGCVIAAILWMFTAVTPYTVTHVIFTTSLSTWSQGQDFQSHLWFRVSHHSYDYEQRQGSREGWHRGQWMWGLLYSVLLSSLCCYTA